MKARTIFAVAALLGVCTMTAQETKEEPKFKINPTGRILMDGAVFVSPQKEMFKDGVAIPDARLGVKMTYGKWKAKIDVGFAYNKVGLKDLLFEYDFNDRNLIRLGSFIHQYGLQSATSSSMKITMEEPISNAVFNDSRQIGAMYVHNAPKFLATASVHTEPSATTVILVPDQFTKESFGVRSRLVWRPLTEGRWIFQTGISGAFATPQRNGNPDTHDAFTFASNFPTRVTQVKAISATVDNARNLWKFTPELLVGYGPVALESQYYFQQVNRKDNLTRYQAHGAYATVRGLILGGDYEYSPWDGGLATPKKGALECVVSYNYTKLSDYKSGILGGNLNDVSLTMNYYINKYMIARLHYSYTHTFNRAGVEPISLNAIMARLQVIF